MNRQERISQYKKLCEQGKISNLFNQPWWLDATGEWDVVFGLRNEQVVGAFPYAVGKRMGIKTIGMPALTHHLRLWMDKPPDISDHKWLTREKQIIWSMIDQLPGYGFFSMVFDERSFDNWLPFHWKGFRQEMRYTFVIDQVAPDILDQQLNRNLKRSLKLEGYKIRLTKEVSADDFYALCHNTYKRQNMKMPFSKTLFEKIDQAIQKNNAGIKIGELNPQGKLIAASYLLWDKDTAYYFLAGDNEEGREIGASIVLCRQALRIAFEEKNLQHFDFCGSMLESITEMRRQFGARAVPLMKIFKAKWKWLDILYSLTR
jgi:hypothetical protein